MTTQTVPQDRTLAPGERVILDTEIRVPCSLCPAGNGEMLVAHETTIGRYHIKVLDRNGVRQGGLILNRDVLARLGADLIALSQTMPAHDDETVGKKP